MPQQRYTPEQLQFIDQFRKMSPDEQADTLSGMDADKQLNLLSAVHDTEAATPQASAASRFGSGMSGQLLGTEHPIEAIKHPIDTARSAAHNLGGIASVFTPSNLAESSKQIYEHPLSSAADIAKAGGEFVGQVTGLEPAYKKYEQGDYAGAAGTLLGAASPMLISRASKLLKATQAGVPLGEALAEGKVGVELPELMTREGGSYGKMTKPNGFPTTAGFMSKSKSVQSLEALLHDIPFARQPLKSVQEAQQAIIDRFVMEMPKRAMTAKAEADALYEAIKMADPMTGENSELAILTPHGKAMLRGVTEPIPIDKLLTKRHLLSEAAYRASKAGDAVSAAKLTEEVVQQDEAILNRLKAIGQPDLIAKYNRARRLVNKQHAIEDVERVMRQHLEGMDIREQTAGQAVRGRTFSGKDMLNALNKMKDAPGGNRLVQAFGYQGAVDIRTAVQAVMLAQSRGFWGYKVAQLMGATIGTMAVGSTMHMSYLGEAITGAAAAGLIAHILAHPEAAAIFSSFLRAGRSSTAAALYLPKLIKAVGIVANEREVPKSAIVAAQQLGDSSDAVGDEIDRFKQNPNEGSMDIINKIIHEGHSHASAQEAQEQETAQ